MTPFADLLSAAIERVGSPVCVGLDPVHEMLPDAVRSAHHEPLESIRQFGRGVIDAVVGVVPAIKLQSACYERWGGRGLETLAEHAEHASSLGLVVILDAKRGDIGLSSRHYAHAARRQHAHAVTVSGYLGLGALDPFVEVGLGVFVLVRTSNPDGDAVQGARLEDGRTVAEMMADQVAAYGAKHVGASGGGASHGLSSVGAVVGATKHAEARALRERMPDQIFLIPGYGAQGGTAEDIRAMLRPRAARRSSLAGAGVLVTASRSVIYATGAGRGRNGGGGGSGGGWTDHVRAAAERLAGEIRDVVESGSSGGVSRSV
ncbi:MAG: orotidine-5'-phosphate decarboxylase [Phycisphaerales bacterium]|nr:MAG: orotidine-5'-phosphate decarboxylase [Phycisphaerales bacterium]